MKIYFPGKLVFGRGVLSGLVEEIQQMRVSRVLVVTIEPLLKRIQGVIDGLEGIEVRTDTTIVQEPSFSDLRDLMKRVDPFDPELVLGIGGGSVLDIAKLVAAQSGNEQVLEEYAGLNLLQRRPKKLICVPATSGTGSEVSPNAILVDGTDNQKKGIISPYLVPDVVYVDPLLTLSVPASITAATGLDALTHCMEAYTNLYAQPFIDMYALEGIRLIGANLVRAVQDGSDEEAREKVAMGSLLGGFCLGPVNTAAVHALSYPLGSTFHLPHGLSNALLLPYVMEFNSVAAPCRYAEVAVALGCVREKDDGVTAQKGVERIRMLIRKCGIPARLSEVGVPRNAISDMAVAAMKITRLLKNNPRPVTVEDAIAIYENAY
jgi:alcohol dehydrogenase class IV